MAESVRALENTTRTERKDLLRPSQKGMRVGETLEHDRSRLASKLMAPVIYYDPRRRRWAEDGKLIAVSESMARVMTTSDPRRLLDLAFPMVVPTTETELRTLSVPLSPFPSGFWGGVFRKGDKACMLPPVGSSQVKRSEVEVLDLVLNDDNIMIQVKQIGVDSEPILVPEQMLTPLSYVAGE